MKHDPRKAAGANCGEVLLDGKEFGRREFAWSCAQSVLGLLGWWLHYWAGSDE
jgi:hypothetical protein